MLKEIMVTWTFFGICSNKCKFFKTMQYGAEWLNVEPMGYLLTLSGMLNENKVTGLLFCACQTKYQ